MGVVDDKKGRGGNGKETYRGGGWGWVEMTREMSREKGRGGHGKGGGG